MEEGSRARSSRPPYIAEPQGGGNMTGMSQIDRTYNYILGTLVKRGYAPHFTEIAKEFSLTPEEGKRLLHELMDDSKLPIWLYPGTDLIASFAPFNNLPTQYRVSVDGEQKWFAQ